VKIRINKMDLARSNIPFGVLLFERLERENIR